MEEWFIIQKEEETTPLEKQLWVAINSLSYVDGNYSMHVPNQPLKPATGHYCYMVALPT